MQTKVDKNFFLFPVVTYPTLLLNFKLEIPLLGINFTPWRLLIVVLAIPSGIGGIAISFFHESPKFLANSGKNEEALEVLKSMHKINNRGSKDEFGVINFILILELLKRSVDRRFLLICLQTLNIIVFFIIHNYLQAFIEVKRASRY